MTISLFSLQLFTFYTTIRCLHYCLSIFYASVCALHNYFPMFIWFLHMYEDFMICSCSTCITLCVEILLFYSIVYIVVYSFCCLTRNSCVYLFILILCNNWLQYFLSWSQISLKVMAMDMMELCFFIMFDFKETYLLSCFAGPSFYTALLTIFIRLCEEYVNLQFILNLIL